MSLVLPVVGHESKHQKFDLLKVLYEKCDPLPFQSLLKVILEGWLTWLSV